MPLGLSAILQILIVEAIMKISNCIVEGLCWLGGFVLLFVCCFGCLALLLGLLSVAFNVFVWVSWAHVFAGAFLWAALLLCFFAFKGDVKVRADIE